MTIPLSLYIHFPWCVRKCPYCDFNSHTLRHDLPEKDYIELLLQDFYHDLKYVEGRSIHSIFMGGGTPSLFSAESIAYLLSKIREMIPFQHADIEITLEANPGTVEQEKFTGFYQAGINRLSMGIQSFQNDKLQSLGRIHDAETALTAITTAKQAGFTNFNIDLMHGLPNQTVDDALYDLRTALQFSPPHLSWYQLTLEPNTLFYQKPPTLPAEDILFDIQQAGQVLLKQHHFQHYEVSAYCQNTLVSQHNLNYWCFGDYLGIGAGAHGKITDLTTHEIMRYTKIKHPRDYLQASHFIATQNSIHTQQLPFEFMLNALRLHQPVTWQLFNERTGLSSAVILPEIKYLQDKELLYYNENHFYATPLGHRFLNDVLTTFMA